MNNMIDQVTVFLENKKGRLAALCRALGDAGVSMHAMTVADTTDYGIVRIISDSPDKARETLMEAGFRVTLTKVFAIAVPNRAGALADLLEALDRAEVNVEYAYCFAIEGDMAIDVLRIEGDCNIKETIEAAGFRLLEAHEIYA